MKLLFERYRLISKLPPEELITRLQEQLGKRPLFFFGSITKPYWGKIHGNSFKIEPAVVSNKDRGCLIKGDISATGTGSVIKLSMRIFISTYITMVAVIAGCIYLLSLYNTEVVSVSLFFILVPLGICIAVFQIFKYQVEVSKAFLLHLFEAEEVH